MSLGFTGCNPTETWPPYSEGVARENYPPDLGMEALVGGNTYVLVRAKRALSQYWVCYFDDAFYVDGVLQSNERGRCGVLQTDLPNGHTGWILVNGKGTAAFTGGRNRAQAVTVVANLRGRVGSGGNRTIGGLAVASNQSAAGNHEVLVSRPAIY